MKSLTKQEMINVIEGKGCAWRVPMAYNMWIHPNVYGDNKEAVEKLLSDYPYDIEKADINMPSVFVTETSADFTWTRKQFTEYENKAIDSCVALEDWNELDELLANFPNPYDIRLMQPRESNSEKYVLAAWWFCFFERFWSLRGMENALTDFYLYPDEVHSLFRKLTDYYKVIIERAHNELGADGVFTSDDIGTQTSPFFSPDIFKEFFKPYYKELFDKAHSLGMHFWLHTCGNIEAFIPDFIEIGLDVLHPIQKHTMDEVKIAEKYGDKICFLAGFDVQQTIPYGTPQQVRSEVRHLIDAYANKTGRFILAAGNNCTPDWKTESIHSLLDETYFYGTEKCKAFSACE